MRWCNKYKWTTKTETRVFEDQNTSSLKTFGGGNCKDNSNLICYGTNECKWAVNGSKLEGMKQTADDVGYCIHKQATATAWKDCPPG